MASGTGRGPYSAAIAKDVTVRFSCRVSPASRACSVASRAARSASPNRQACPWTVATSRQARHWPAWSPAVPAPGATARPRPAPGRRASGSIEKRTSERTIRAWALSRSPAASSSTASARARRPRRMRPCPPAPRPGRAAARSAPPTRRQQRHRAAQQGRRRRHVAPLEARRPAEPGPGRQRAERAGRRRRARARAGTGMPARGGSRGSRRTRTGAPARRARRRTARAGRRARA